MAHLQLTSGQLLPLPLQLLPQAFPPHKQQRHTQSGAQRNCCAQTADDRAACNLSYAQQPLQPILMPVTLESCCDSNHSQHSQANAVVEEPHGTNTAAIRPNSPAVTPSFTQTQSPASETKLHMHNTGRH